MDLNDIISRLKKIIKELSELLGTNDDETLILFHHFRWNKNKLETSDYFANPDKIREAAGLVPLGKKIEKPTGEEFHCPICWDNVPVSTLEALSCGHFLCGGCWDNYIKDKVPDRLISASLTHHFSFRSTTKTKEASGRVLPQNAHWFFQTASLRSMSLRKIWLLMKKKSRCHTLKKTRLLSGVQLQIASSASKIQVWSPDQCFVDAGTSTALNAAEKTIGHVTVQPLSHGRVKTQLNPQTLNGFWSIPRNVRNADILLKRTRDVITWLADTKPADMNSAGSA